MTLTDKLIEAMGDAKKKRAYEAELVLCRDAMLRIVERL
jgi:hypothetical protein